MPTYDPSGSGTPRTPPSLGGYESPDISGPRRPPPAGGTGGGGGTGPSGGMGLSAGAGGTPPRRSFRPHFPRTWWGRSLLFGPLAGFLLIALVVIVIAVRTHVVLPDALPQQQNSVVLAADGSPLGNVPGKENRTIIPISQVPTGVRDAVLAAEDRNFYHESGVSLTGTARAAVSDVVHRRIQAGGSTITQQYVKNAYLTNKRTFSRKLQEVIIAFKINRKYTKDEVLGFYLNTIPFGRGAFGIQAAAQTYFGVDAAHLDVAQGALLAASIQGPSRLDPAVHPQLAMTRWNYVIAGMVKDRALTPAQAAALTYPAFLPRNSRGAGGGGALSGVNGYIVDMAQSELDTHHLTAAQVYAGGLKIRTTIVPKAQAATQMAVEGVLRSPGDPQAALVAIEPGTGRIEAVYGGHDFATRPFNNAVQALRQPGSSFKPYVLVAALSQNASLTSTFNGASPQTFPGYSSPVSNFNNEQFPNVDLITATANSVNTVYVPLAQKAGIPNVINAARAAGIPATDPGNGLQLPVSLAADASLALGTSEVYPIDQASAFATFAAGGKAAIPFLIDSVTDSGGHELFRSSVKARPDAINPGVVSNLTFALQSVIAKGTANPEAVLAGGRPAAGKTGTTSDSRDAWFVGYTPSLSTAVWMGYDPKTPTDKATLKDVEGVSAVTGGTLPARIWKRFMDAALAGSPIQNFPPPAMGGQDFNPPPAPPSTLDVPTSAAPASSTLPAPATTAPGPPSTEAVPTTSARTTTSRPPRTTLPPTTSGPTTTAPP